MGPRAFRAIGTGEPVRPVIFPPQCCMWEALPPLGVLKPARLECRLLAVGSIDSFVGARVFSIGSARDGAGSMGSKRDCGHEIPAGSA